MFTSQVRKITRGSAAFTVLAFLLSQGANANERNVLEEDFRRAAVQAAADVKAELKMKFAESLLYPTLPELSAAATEGEGLHFNENPSSHRIKRMARVK